MPLTLRALIIGLLLVVLPTSVAAVPATAQSPLATASIDPSQLGNVIPPTFMGFSHEWNGSPPNVGGAAMMGSPETGTNPIYRQLVQNLLAYGAGPFVVRIGGNSNDTVTSVADPSTLDAFAQLNADTGATFVLGVNLGKGDVQLAQNQAAAYVQAMPPGSLAGIEIGNEPDFYPDNGDRPKTYGEADYLQDYATWRSAIAPVLPPGLGFVGPSWGSMSVTARLPTFLDQEGANLAFASQHAYAGTACNTNNPPDFLLKPEAVSTSVKGSTTSVMVSHQHGLPYRMAEMNSISCAGQAGVSDTFTSALWVADLFFAWVNEGIDGVNIHFGNSNYYSLFTFDIATSDGTTTFGVQSIRPEYYGVLLFQQAAPAGSQLVPVTVNHTANVSVWATEDGSGTIRVLVVNKDHAGPFSLQLPGYGDGTLTRMLAPAYNAKTGITLGGQTFDGSPDGTLQGTPTSDVVSGASGTYMFDMPIQSAALLVVPPAAG